MSYCFWLAARVLLYIISHRQDSTYHNICYTSCGTLAGIRNSSLGPLQEIDPMAHCTMSASSHRQDNTHTRCGKLAEIALWVHTMKDRSVGLSHTMSKRSYHGATFRFFTNGILKILSHCDIPHLYHTAGGNHIYHSCWTGWSRKSSIKSQLAIGHGYVVVKMN